MFLGGAMSAQARRGLTLVELLVVMFIMSILMAFIAVVLMNIGSEPRKRKALADIAKMSMALSEYKNHFGEYPPDTGYGLDMEGNRPVYVRKVRGEFVNVPTYDPGGLWRYLCRRVRDPKTGELVGPFLDEWPQSQLQPYDDPFDAAGQPSSRYLVDPWGNPYGFIGDRRRVLHKPGSFDIFSAGSDGVTACNNGEDDDLLGDDAGDNYADCSEDPQSVLGVDNRAYNSRQNAGVWREIDDDQNGIANDSGEFGPEAIRNGDLGDDVNNWSSR
jgi:prepilin-type N-terminal cleavage/methylation domain-containing protein